MKPDSSQWCENMRQQAQTKIRKFYLKVRRNIFAVRMVKYWNRLFTVVQQCCGFSVFGDIKNSAGHDLEHPVVVDPDLSTRLELGYLQRSLPVSAIL